MDEEKLIPKMIEWLFGEAAEAVAADVFGHPPASPTDQEYYHRPQGNCSN